MTRRYVVSAAVVDLLPGDDEALVLLPGTFHRLSAIGAGVLEACRTAATAADIGSELVSRFGAPEEGDLDELVAAAVGDLLAAGILDVEAEVPSGSGGTSDGVTGPQ